MSKKNILILGFCFLFFLVWYPFMQRIGWIRPGQPVEPPAEVVPATADEPEAVPPTEAVPSRTPADIPQLPQAPTAIPAAAGQATAAILAREEAPVHTHRLSVPGISQVVLDRDRGGIGEVRLLQYLSDDRQGKVTLGDYRFPYCSLVELTGDWSFGGDAEIVTATDRELVLRRTVSGRPLEVTESWQLGEADTYRIAYRVTISNHGDQPVTAEHLAITLGGMSTGEGGKGPRFSRVGAIDLGLEVAVDEKERPLSFTAKEISKGDERKQAAWANRPMNWAAVHNKYFLFYLAGETTPFTGWTADVAEVTTEDESADDWLYAQALLPVQTVMPGETLTLDFSGYAGPKEYERLHAIGGGLESVMRLDLFMFWRTKIMGVISVTILKSVTALNQWIDHRWGFGFAIIIVTFVIKILFWPLTHKSTVSMRKMQKLQPLMQEIRQKYKDDVQVMNRKIMDLYREHKVSPLGGCLPILLQIPVFFALFNTLRGAIQLRQASFFWVADLSTPDTLPWELFGFPIRPLAILMGISMLAQQALSPTTGDPAQKRMMTFMSLFFMFIFYSMPAGLTLYWTTNQVLTIGQTMFTRWLEKREK